MYISVEYVAVQCNDGQGVLFYFTHFIALILYLVHIPIELK
jgi:hypothetical protein